MTDRFPSIDEDPNHLAFKADVESGALDEFRGQAAAYVNGARVLIADTKVEAAQAIASDPQYDNVHRYVMRIPLHGEPLIPTVHMGLAFDRHVLRTEHE